MRTYGLMLMVVGLVGTLSALAQAEQISGIPAGAVLAFNLSECPAGWKRFDAANGRTIVGLGQSGPEGADYRLGDVGGEETHALTSEEMPVHDHGLAGAGNGTRLNKWSISNTQYAVPWPRTRDGSFQSARLPQGWRQGEGHPHNNMPPFVALLYCEKK